MNSNTKGRVSELLAAAKYISLGYIVLQPINKDGVYDFIIEKSGVFKRVQVKTLLDIGDVYALSLRSIRHNRVKNTIKKYNKCDIDIFVGVDLKLGKIFEVPFNFKNTNQLYLRKKISIRKIKKKLNLASDYEI